MKWPPEPHTDATTLSYTHPRKIQCTEKHCNKASSHIHILTTKVPSSTTCESSMDCNKVAASTTNPDACIKTNLLQIDNHTKGLHVDIHRSLFSQRNSNWYQQLITNVQWHRVKYKSNRFQKECETPCWTAFYIHPTHPSHPGSDH